MNFEWKEVLFLIAFVLIPETQIIYFNFYNGYRYWDRQSDVNSRALPVRSGK